MSIDALVRLPAHAIGCIATRQALLNIDSPAASTASSSAASIVAESKFDVVTTGLLIIPAIFLKVDIWEEELELARRDGHDMKGMAANNFVERFCGCFFSAGAFV